MAMACYSFMLENVLLQALSFLFCTCTSWAVSSLACCSLLLIFSISLCTESCFSRRDDSISMTWNVIKVNFKDKRNITSRKRQSASRVNRELLRLGPTGSFSWLKDYSRGEGRLGKRSGGEGRDRNICMREEGKDNSWGEGRGEKRRGCERSIFCGKRGGKLFLRGRKGRRKRGGEGSFFVRRGKGHS